MMIVRLVKPKDVQADFMGELEFLKKNEPDVFDMLINAFLYDNNLSYTLESNGKIIGIVRGIMYAPRCMYIALYPTKEIFNYKIAAAKTMKKFMHHVANCFNLERIETRSLDDEFLNRWHEWIGFSLEGTSKKWCYGFTYNLWGIVYGS